MIYIGTDIIDINRIRKNINLKNMTFLNKIFTLKEIEYCNLKLDPAMHLAGRFAAKEAVKKAILSSGVLTGITMKKIEILSVNGVPEVSISEIDNNINISISHTNTIATATAVLMK